MKPLLFIFMAIITLPACVTEGFNDLDDLSVNDVLDASECLDLLQVMAEKPGDLELIDCRPGQGQLLFKATYRVSGQNAAIVEEFLVSEYGMGALKFVCCGWEEHESASGSFEPNTVIKGWEHAHYSVTMFSEETLVNERDKWNEIDSFYVWVEVLEI